MYLAVLNITGSDETPSLGQALVGLPAALAGAWTALAALPAPRPRRRGVRAASVVLPLLIALMVAPVALAHDPGNGPDAGHVAWTVASRGRALAVTARADERPCRVVPVALVARRAGTTVRSPLNRARCSLSGRLRVPSTGRWFVYVNFRRSESLVESWLPLEVTTGRSTMRNPHRFAYGVQRRPSTAVKTAVGAVLYTIVGAFLVALVLLVRRSGSITPVGPPSPSAGSA